MQNPTMKRLMTHLLQIGTPLVNLHIEVERKITKYK